MDPAVVYKLVDRVSKANQHIAALARSLDETIDACARVYTHVNELTSRVKEAESRITAAAERILELEKPYNTVPQPVKPPRTCSLCKHQIEKIDLLGPRAKQYHGIEE